jgi:hypothetical protein
MTDDQLEDAIATVHHAQNIDQRIGAEPRSYIIIDVPAIGPNGGHYASGLRVYPAKPQAPGGILPPGALPPGEVVATVDADGVVHHSPRRP